MSRCSESHYIQMASIELSGDVYSFRQWDRLCDKSACKSTNLTTMMPSTKPSTVWQAHTVDECNDFIYYDTSAVCGQDGFAVNAKAYPTWNDDMGGLARDEAGVIRLWRRSSSLMLFALSRSATSLLSK